jgi:hypothetical protein
MSRVVPVGGDDDDSQPVAPDEVLQDASPPHPEAQDLSS